MNRDKRFRCDICGTTIIGLDEFLTHVKECGAKEKAKLKEAENKKYLEEVNASINKVKAAKDYYDTCLKEFKEKYPKEYEMNFGKSVKDIKEVKSNNDVKYMDEVEFLKLLLGLNLTK